MASRNGGSKYLREKLRCQRGACLPSFDLRGRRRFVLIAPFVNLAKTRHLHQNDWNKTAHFQPELSRVDRHKPNQIVFSLSENECIGCKFFLYVESARSTSSALMKP